MKLKKTMKYILISVLIIIVIFMCAILIFIHSTINSIKDIDISISKNQSYNSTVLFDNSSNIISSPNNNYVNYSDIPAHTIEAFISIEDKDFFNHNGLNFKRIIGATLNNIKSFKFKEGASTITQQLIKNKHLTNEKTISRKIKEAYLAIKLEKTEPKEKILESYLNTIYYGHGIYGIENASKYYFNKPTKELTLNESCVLAGLIKSPAHYSPINNYKKCISRKKIVINELLQDGKISNEEFNKLNNESIELNIQEQQISNLNLYEQYALDEASKILKMDKNKILQLGYKIYTYKDNNIQKALDQSINNENNYDINEYGNIADSLGIIIDNKTHGVSAISGKSQYNLVNFNRQPGSLIKPILVYTPAFEEELIYPSSYILDEEININGYSPNNVGNNYYGYINIKDCVAKSLNIPAVKLCNKLSIEKCKSYASKCGIEFNKNDNGLAIALGGLTDGCTLKEITDAYSVYSNNGNYIKSSFIKEIKNNNNLSIYNNLMTMNDVFSSEASYLTTECLKQSVKNGTSKKLSSFNYDIAGKTGTVNVKNSNLNTDAYSLAFTSDHTICVWLGNYTMNEKYNLRGNNNGGTFATEIVKQTFQDIYSNNTPSNFTIPNTIVKLPIDSISLQNKHEVLIANNFPDKYVQYEIFSKNNQPTKISNIFTNISNDSILTAKENKNSITISFIAHDYYTYELYRINNSTHIKLNTYTNKDGLIEFIDNDLEFNNNYQYYLKISSKYNNNSITTNYVNAKISKNYFTINDNSSWIFS